MRWARYLWCKERKYKRDEERKRRVASAHFPGTKGSTLTLLVVYSLKYGVNRLRRREDDKTHSNNSSSENRCFEARFSCDSAS